MNENANEINKGGNTLFVLNLKLRMGVLKFQKE